MIELQSVSFSYPDRTPALRGLTLTIRHGESVCLAGANGAGKSTFLLLLTGLLQAQAGSIKISGQKPAPDGTVGLVFQNPEDQLFCPTVAEDVAFGPVNRKLPEAEIRQRVQEALQATGMQNLALRNARHLSGGEKKRAALAAVLADRPEVLALDEPWANLDARGGQGVSRIVSEFTGTRIIASQDLYHAAEVCERLVILAEGQVVADGPMAELLRDTSLLAKWDVDYGRRCRFCPQGSGDH